MTLFQKQYLTIPIFFVILLIISYFLLNQTIDHSRNLINLLIDSVIPTLLPYIILTSLFIHFGGGYLFSYFLQYLTIPLFKVNGNSGVIIILALLSGFPITALIVDKMLKDNVIDHQTGERMVNYIFFISPAFLYGIIGTILSDFNLILLIAISHYLSGFILLYISSFKIKNNNLKYLKWSDILHELKTKSGKPLSESLIQIIQSSIKLMIIICGTILLFSLPSIWVYDFFPDLFNYIFSGVLEFSYASIQLSKLYYENNSLLTISILLFIISFSGLAVILQTSIFLAKNNLSIKKFIFARSWHGFITVFIFLLINYFMNL